MDPDETLRVIRMTVKQLLEEDRPIGSDVLPQFIQHARDLSDYVTVLDDWLSRDGHLPADWMAEEDKPLCTIEHGDWTGPHIRISSCPSAGYDPHGGVKHRYYEEN